MESNQKAFKSGVWYTISNFALKGIDFITIPVFARIMSQAQYGEYSNYTSWLQIVLIIGTLYLSTSLYSARYDFEKKLNSYICTILVVGTLSAVIELFLISCFKTRVVEFSNIDYKYIVIMYLYAMVRPAFEIFLTNERLKYNYKSSVLISSLASLSSVIISIMLVILMRDKLQARILGTYCPLIVICAIIYLHYLKNGFAFNASAAKYALTICIPYVPHALAMTVLSSTDRIMITHYCGAEETALYSLAYTCALAVTVLWSSINTAFAPWLGEKIHNNEYLEVKKFSSKYVLIVAIPILGLILAAPEMLLIVGGRSYLSATNVIPPVMAGCFVQFIYSMYVNIEQFLKKTKGMAIASILGALLNLILNYIFIPQYGYIAAAYTTLVGYIFLFLAHYYLVHRIKMCHIYNTKFIVIAIIAVLFISIGCSFIYQFHLIRYCVIATYVCFFVYIVIKMDVRNLLRKQ